MLLPIKVRYVLVLHIFPIGLECQVCRFFIILRTDLQLIFSFFLGDLPAENPDNSRLFRAPDGAAPVRLAVEQPPPPHLRRRPRTAAGPGRVGNKKSTQKTHLKKTTKNVFLVF